MHRPHFNAQSGSAGWDWAGNAKNALSQAKDATGDALATAGEATEAAWQTTEKNVKDSYNWSKQKIHEATHPDGEGSVYLDAEWANLVDQAVEQAEEAAKKGLAEYEEVMKAADEKLMDIYTKNKQALEDAMELIPTQPDWDEDSEDYADDSDDLDEESEDGSESESEDEFDEMDPSKKAEIKKKKAEDKGAYPATTYDTIERLHKMP